MTPRKAKKVVRLFLVYNEFDGSDAIYVNGVLQCSEQTLYLCDVFQSAGGENGASVKLFFYCVMFEPAFPRLFSELKRSVIGKGSE